MTSYTIEAKSFPALLSDSRLAVSLRDKLARPIVTSGEITPCVIAPVVARSKSGKNVVYPMIWGIKTIEQTLFLASVTSLPHLFPKEETQSRRCVILASYFTTHREPPDDPAFSDWHEGDPTDKDLYAVQPSGNTVCYLGGVYTVQDGAPYYMILSLPKTTLPVILPEKMISLWLDPKKKVEQLVRKSLRDVVWVKV